MRSNLWRKARHRRTNWEPTSTQARSTLVLLLELRDLLVLHLKQLKSERTFPKALSRDWLHAA